MPGRKKKAAPQGAPEWVVTYGDMMSLLLTFFVLLFSMSEIKREESIAFLESLRRRFGNADAPMSLMPGQFRPSPTAPNRNPSSARARREDTHKGGDRAQAPVGDYPRVRTLHGLGQPIQGGVVFFAPGEALINSDGERTLRQVAELLAGKPQKIEIRGHSSSRPLPPGSPFRDHRHLAFERAMVVMDRLVALRIEKGRLRVAVAGDSEPLTVVPRSETAYLNDRVEVLLLDEIWEPPLAPPQTVPPPPSASTPVAPRSPSP